MSKPKILVQLDTDPQASVFDGVVAVDAGVDHLFRHAGVQPEQVRDLVYGAMFTRGVGDLRGTAVFIGGSDVAAGERLLKESQQAFFGPMRVSLMLDSNGANTTAAAAVLSAAKHLPLAGAQALVLAATGPVGCRVVRLLAAAGARVRVASRSHERAAAVCRAVAKQLPEAELEPCVLTGPAEISAALHGVSVLIAAGAPGVELLSAEDRRSTNALVVAIDLSAVPPAGIGGIEPGDRAVQRDDVTCYGAIGVGGLKMKIHKAAILQLFTANDHVLDAEQIFNIGRRL